MSVDHTPRLTGVVKAALKEAAMGEPYGYHVSFGYWPKHDGEGNITGMGPAWFIAVTIRDGLSPEPIGNGFPVHGILPNDDTFRIVAQGLLERCRQDRDKKQQAEMAEVQRIPAGLRGKDLTGLVG